MLPIPGHTPHCTLLCDLPLILILSPRLLAPVLQPDTEDNRLSSLLLGSLQGCTEPGVILGTSTPVRLYHIWLGETPYASYLRCQHPVLGSSLLIPNFLGLLWVQWKSTLVGPKQNRKSLGKTPEVSRKFQGRATAGPQARLNPGTGHLRTG